MSKEKEDKYVPRTVHQNKVEGIEYEEEKVSTYIFATVSC